MISFDTDGLRPDERFDHWCEVRAKGLFGVTIEVSRERRPDFHGRFSAYETGGATVAELQASSYRVSRTWADIKRMSGDSLNIFQQVRGPGMLRAGEERVHMIADGTMTIAHSDVPFAGTPIRSDGFHFRALKIPVTGNARLAAGAENLLCEPLLPETPVARLIEAIFAAIVEQRIEAAHADATIRHIAQLALLARGRVTPGTSESRNAVRHGYLQMALALLRSHLLEPDLSPTRVARALNISVRQLHLLFEPTGQSFARTVLAMRLAEARRQMESMPLRPVAEIASASGFDSLATFYRTFRQTYGMAPGDLRKDLRLG
ncbi:MULTISPECIES: AraC family transcriptional regulator [unclassified Bradyrhizobium]|uniref:AraC family transcriptional regulator n=1 Tax=unclassified Bradyrhizobium TaxID=2631580 RepID=UPI001BABF574|nr:MULTISPECIES: AraC family transcriptional regulator [unclassified Bradyrhizobium]MBR1224786.1 helix-turn-helix transcriptional regulator [Bradyrhizobium sp. AUGA SZCCT0176]MBR1301707.1 helix-turn-helix transcriptional regulator [Bradyrhizobium sp. AUGA SZCCT0042]